MDGGAPAWDRLETAIVACTRCPRLVEHTRTVARVRRRAYRDQDYWGRPVPAFGDRSASVLVVGLAPGAHGANRTGRMFTGDRSGEWLYEALHRAGLSERPVSASRDDGLALHRTLVTAACRCAPPGNRPTRDELDNCSIHLDRELDLLTGLRVAVALGAIAWDAILRRAKRVAPSSVPRPRPRFAHGAETRLILAARRPPVALIASYHPSQQNTQTGRLSRPMLDTVFRRAASLASLPARGRRGSEEDR